MLYKDVLTGLFLSVYYIVLYKLALPFEHADEILKGPPFK